MIFRTRHCRIVLLILVVGFSLRLVLPTTAQTLPMVKDLENAPALEANNTDIEYLQLDWSQLNVDTSTLATSPPSKGRLPQTGPGTEISWSSRNQPNGSAAVSVKRPVSSFWDARIGADITVTREPATPTGSELLSEKLANGGNLPQSSGAAWAAVTAPGVGSIWDKTAIEARIDPTQEQRKIGTTLSKSVPLSEQYSLTLQNDYNIIQQSHSAPPCADCGNLSAISIPGTPGHPGRNYQTGQSAKLSIAGTGTSFTAGQTLSSTDDKWLRKIGAEQKLFADVNISGSIGETAQGTTNKSLTAGFKRSW